MRHDYGKIQYQLNQYRIKKKEAETIRDQLQAKLNKLKEWEN